MEKTTQDGELEEEEQRREDKTRRGEGIEEAGLLEKLKERGSKERGEVEGEGGGEGGREERRRQGGGGKALRTRIQLRESTIDTPSQVSSTSFPARIGAFTIPRAGAFGIGLAPGARTPLRARALCDSEPGMEGVIRQNTPKQGWRPLKTEPQPGDLPIFFFHGGPYFN
jgi:hypothetical protein